jgi:3-deoxy-D-manno-octulosonic-acid transferase
VGESLSLLPLVEALRALRPELRLLVTSGTVTSAEVLARRLPPGVIHQFAPVDAPGAVRRFLAHWRPDLGVLVESELWPNLIMAARGRGVRLALLSARITAESARGWARAPQAARAILRAFSLVLPQDEASADRLLRLGAEAGPKLNLKLAGAAPPHDAAELARLRKAARGRRVVLAASTHPGEEALIAQAARHAAHGRAGPVLLVAAPRHPERGEAVADTLTELGYQVARRSAGEAPGADVTAYVADTLGEMGLFLRLADVVVMGGSFMDRIGGHNPMEAARVGAAMITGPYVANQREVYREMLAEAAAIEAREGAALARHIEGLLTYPGIRRRLGDAALAFAERQGAELAAALALLEPLLPA